MAMKHALLDLFRRRFACHRFLRDRPIPKEDLGFVLEAGRLSPSSFGLEQWKFLVLTQPEDKARLQAACFDQPQVGSASAVIVILAKLTDLDPDSDYVKRLLEREYPGDNLAFALGNYRNFHANTDVAAWSTTQCHIAAANMMTAATAVGIDSCAIGGFLPDPVRDLLQITADRYAIALILALGYCDETPPDKQRLPLADLVEYR
jgi:nitroreductase